MPHQKLKVSSASASASAGERKIKATRKVSGLDFMSACLCVKSGAIAGRRNARYQRLAPVQMQQLAVGSSHDSIGVVHRHFLTFRSC